MDVLMGQYKVYLDSIFIFKHKMLVIGFIKPFTSIQVYM